jgi:hypothetical protein
VAHPKGGSGALYRGQGENKKKGGVTVKKYYIFKNIFNNKEIKKFLRKNYFYCFACLSFWDCLCLTVAAYYQ